MNQAELDAIAAEERAGNLAPGAPGAPAGGGGGPGAAAPAAPPVVDQAAIDRAEASEWAELPAGIGGILCMALPELREAYSPANCARWGEAMMRVAKKYHWRAAMIGPEIGLALVSVPLIMPTVVAVRARRAKAAPAGDAGAGEAPAGGESEVRRIAPVG